MFIAIIFYVQETAKKVVFQLQDKVLPVTINLRITSEQIVTYGCCGVTWGLLRKPESILIMLPAI